jgi:hypothetical protein
LPPPCLARRTCLLQLTIFSAPSSPVVKSHTTPLSWGRSGAALSVLFPCIGNY